MEKKRHSLTKKEETFVEAVWEHYRAAGRHDLPWRKTADPYKILVSEIMLQQTQVPRVLPKYKEFLKAFPNTKKLAEASLGDVLRVWQGLGYNRRPKFLKQAAEVVQAENKGKWPKTYQSLLGLPGIGSYTAAAVMNFAYNEPVPLIETNVRTVYLHHFFKDKNNVSDNDLIPIIQHTLDCERPREWHWALMDYGSHLKATLGNVNVQSRTYKKQSDFKTSNRYIRGAILKSLLKRPITQKGIEIILSEVSRERIPPALVGLVAEGLVKKVHKTYKLP